MLRSFGAEPRGAYELYPERFTPEKILKVSDRTLQVFLRRLGARFGSYALKHGRKYPRFSWKSITETRETFKDNMVIWKA
jgi:hypothetical protein